MKDRQNKEWICTNCKGDATLAYTPKIIKRGKDKGKERPSWDGKVQPGERLCISCGRNRGIEFF